MKQTSSENSFIEPKTRIRRNAFRKRQRRLGLVIRNGCETCWLLLYNLLTGVPFLLFNNIGPSPESVDKWNVTELFTAACFAPTSLGRPILASLRGRNNSRFNMQSDKQKYRRSDIRNDELNLSQKGLN